MAWVSSGVVDPVWLLRDRADELATELGTGGMATKLASARLASTAGVPVLIAAATDANRALGPADVGTAFAAAPGA